MLTATFQYTENIMIKKNKQTKKKTNKEKCIFHCEGKKKSV